MPPKSTSLPRFRDGGAVPHEPPVMTWMRAAPALVIAGLTDTLKLFFNGFWFFGPAIAAFYCTSKVSDWVGSVWGLTEAACEAAAAAAGTYFSPILASIGVIMAFATALLGFLALVLWILMANLRIFKTVRTSLIQIAAAFGSGAIPFIGAIPSFTPIILRLYRRQIKLEKAAHTKWQKETAAVRLKEKETQLAQIVQLRAAEQTQLRQMQEQQEAANDEQYHVDEIPDQLREAA